MKPQDLNSAMPAPRGSCRPGPSRHDLPEAVLAQLREMAAADMNMSEASRQLGLSYKAVWKQSQRHGIPFNTRLLHRKLGATPGRRGGAHRAWTEQEDGLLRACARHGVCAADAATVLGRSYHAIWPRTRMLGITMPSAPHEPNWWERRKGERAVALAAALADAEAEEAERVAAQKARAKLDQAAIDALFAAEQAKRVAAEERHKAALAEAERQRLNRDGQAAATSAERIAAARAAAKAAASAPSAFERLLARVQAGDVTVVERVDLGERVLARSPMGCGMDLF
jgi:hypothetical protein